MTLDVMANSLVYWAQDVWRAGMFGEGSKIYAMTSEGSTRVVASYGAVSAAKIGARVALPAAGHGVRAPRQRRDGQRDPCRRDDDPRADADPGARGAHRARHRQQPDRAA